MKFFRDITAVVIALLTIFSIIGCTPGKAQTRRDYDDRRYSQPGERAGESYSANRGRTQQRDFGDQNVDFYDDQDQAHDAAPVKDEFGISGSRDSHSAGRGPGYDRAGEPTQKQGYYQTGDASWYGREFHGKTTASGEKFNMYEMTAAHKTLPFGSVVLIKNLDNGRETTVRINDRGPYRGSRIIDLSYNAAKKIDILAQGTARVGIVVLKKGDGAYLSGSDQRQGSVEPVVDSYDDDSASFGRDAERLSLQAGAFYSRRNAQNLQRRLESLTGRPVVVIQDQDLFKVRIEGIKGRSEAARFKTMLSDEDISSFIVDSRE